MTNAIDQAKLEIQRDQERKHIDFLKRSIDHEKGLKENYEHQREITERVGKMTTLEFVDSKHYRGR